MLIGSSPNRAESNSVAENLIACISARLFDYDHGFFAHSPFIRRTDVRRRFHSACTLPLAQGPSGQPEAVHCTAAVCAPKQEKVEPITNNRLPVGNRARLGVRSWTPKGSCAPACGRKSMAAVLRIPVPGRFGHRQQDKSAGSSLGASEREQIEMQPRQQSQRRRQQRRHASRGPCRRNRNGNSPGGIRPDRSSQTQIVAITRTCGLR